MEPLLRILDANLNRAREGLRVLEDLARFAIDRRDLCEACKAARHDLTSAISSLVPDSTRLLVQRDTPADVGTTVSTAAEFHRTGLVDVTRAAAGRAQEALRSIEEACKALGSPAAARRVESLRYRAYTIERDLVLALPSGRATQWRLCVIITAALCKHHPWERVIELALEGGADCIQLREKHLTDRDLLARAIRVVDLCRARGVASIINDRPDIAAISGAAGVHIGPHDLSVPQTRAIIGHAALIGVSASTLDRARAAVGLGADYLGLGAMFETSTKNVDVIAGPALVRSLLADPAIGHIPHLAIGGINPGKIHELLRAGCRGVAVSSAVCAAEDPRTACREILAASAATASCR